MQISKISAQSFGCKSCNRNENIKNNNQTSMSKPVAVSRNALIATLVGMLASCQNCDDKYYFGMTPEGNPYIYNQDGDCIDIAPSDVEENFKVFCDKNGK